MVHKSFVKKSFSFYLYGGSENYQLPWSMVDVTRTGRGTGSEPHKDCSCLLAEGEPHTSIHKNTNNLRTDDTHPSQHPSSLSPILNLVWAR